MSTWILAGLVVTAAVVVVELWIPRIGEARVERSLARNGGHAAVGLRAAPALRLLWRSGDRIAVRGHRLAIGISSEGGGLAVIARRAPLGGRSVPVEVEAELASVDGQIELAGGGGTIAGYPAGPLAAMLAAAVAKRLESFV